MFFQQEVKSTAFIADCNKELEKQRKLVRIISLEHWEFLFSNINSGKGGINDTYLKTVIVNFQVSITDSVPSMDSMTQEMFADYFPDQALNPEKNPSFFPHRRIDQPGNDPDEIKV